MDEAKVKFVAKAIADISGRRDEAEEIARIVIAAIDAVERFSTESGYFTSGELLQRFDISPITFYRWERNPSLNFPKPMLINRRKFFRKEDIFAWEASRANGNNS